MIMPGSCSSGFKSWPSGAAGNSRANGLDVSSVNSKNPTLTSPITPNTLATMRSSSCFENIDTAKVQPDKISDHNKMEPSWLPQTAVNL